MDDNEKLRARIIETIQNMMKTMLIRTGSQLDYRRYVIMIRANKFSSVEVDCNSRIHCLSYGTISERLLLKLKNILNVRIRLYGHSV